MQRPFDRVTAREITKVFGPTRALAGVSLVLTAGTVTSIEGPNGAGKSTLLAILATLARATSGTVRYGDLDSREDLDLIRPAIGLVAHESMVYLDLTARETLAFMARLHGITNARARIERALVEAGIVEVADRVARTLSRGQLQRLALARAGLHDPTLMLFDEPTTGLDATAMERLTTTVDAAKRDGRIVVVVTHDRAFADRVADVRVKLERGRTVEPTERP